MPAEKSKDFGGSTKRLLRRMRVERLRALAVLCFALLSVTLTVLGPKILGHGTDLIFNAVRSHHRIDFPALRGVLLTVLALYVCAAAYCRTCSRTRSPASFSARCSGCVPMSRTSSTGCR